MEELLEYDGLIYSIINKYSNKYERDDLYQVGMLGLIDAYNHYDKRYNTKFSTFAYYYILGEVNKYIRESSSIKISNDLIKLKKKINYAQEIMLQKLGREPTNLEISLFLDVDEKLIDNAQLATSSIEDIDSVYNACKVYDDTSATLLDLWGEIDKLSEEEKDIIYARYFSDMTQNEVSNLLGISQVQVSRNENKILKKLRTSL